MFQSIIGFTAPITLISPNVLDIPLKHVSEPRKSVYDWNEHKVTYDGRGSFKKYCLSSSIPSDGTAPNLSVDVLSIKLDMAVSKAGLEISTKVPLSIEICIPRSGNVKKWLSIIVYSNKTFEI
jgi:hypothetical protein